MKNEDGSDTCMPTAVEHPRHPPGRCTPWPLEINSASHSLDEMGELGGVFLSLCGLSYKVGSLISFLHFYLPWIQL